MIYNHDDTQNKKFLFVAGSVEKEHLDYANEKFERDMTLFSLEAPSICEMFGRKFYAIKVDVDPDFNIYEYINNGTVCPVIFEGEDGIVYHNLRFVTDVPADDGSFYFYLFEDSFEYDDESVVVDPDADEEE